MNDFDGQEKPSQQWLDEVRQGGLSYFTHLRRLLKASEVTVLEGDEKQALLDFLEYTEEHLVRMWEWVEECEKEETQWLTKQAAERIRPVGEV